MHHFHRGYCGPVIKLFAVERQPTATLRLYLVHYTILCFELDCFTVVCTFITSRKALADDSVVLAEVHTHDRQTDRQQTIWRRRI